MDSLKKISVIIPTLNESGNIIALIKEIHLQLKQIERKASMKQLMEYVILHCITITLFFLSKPEHLSSQLLMYSLNLRRRETTRENS